ncbi:glyoxalase/bleomycin resistance protein/dioxygenase [Nitzschia inconspicua]|uniref:Glyoxalase/bleomycin resistance protein/dioxygenase n=1 Tax=Nitzschia inconspicua TaxID=303405 RepID=A0A9K3LTC5_9STRA|nr:glyoxalase/bleomycin resistance protein/dioxygenase [Nitzschia inconspicua]
MGESETNNWRTALIQKAASGNKVFLDLNDVRTEVNRIIGCMAHEKSAELSLQSKLTKRKDIANVSWDNISTDFQHMRLGEGSYCHVTKALVRTPGNNDETFGVPDTDCSSSWYALKCLKPAVRLNPKDFKIGAQDLAIEGEILSRLDHPNIIKLHGVSQHDSKTAYSHTENGYFLILDILHDTLKSRLSGLRAKYLPSNRKQRLSTVLDLALSQDKQVLAHVGPVAIGIAEGLQYLHSNGIVMRDLKPDNVGFDTDGTPKIFDLGFAREVHTLKPTEIAGSYRYMAPEVGRRQEVTISSDVYSFGVLLWEMCTLRTPYRHVKTCDAFKYEIMIGDWRESTSTVPSEILRDLIEQCWHPDPNQRPTMTAVVDILKEEFAKYKENIEPKIVETETTSQGILSRSGSFSVGGLSSRESSFASLDWRWRFGSRRSSRPSSFSELSESGLPSDSDHSRSRSGGGGGPIHHVAIKTRNITTAIQFYSLLGFEPTVQFRAGPARAAWLEQKTPCNNPSSMSPADASVSARLELIEIPSFMLNEQDGQTIRAIDLMKRQELLGYNHIALDVTESVDLLDSTNTTSLSEWIQQLNQRSVEMFGKTLRIALKPQQQIIGNSVYELAFIYDADGALLELIRKQTDLPQNVDSGWEPWDGQGFRNAQPPPNY